MRARVLSSALFLASAILAAPAHAQLHAVTCCNKGPVIVYDLSFPNAAHHEAEVKATFTSIPLVNIKSTAASKFVRAASRCPAR